jgi:methylisocitrate lyase
MATSAGERFWQAIEAERPLQVVGAINAYAALLAERAGFRALYLSGAGVANALFRAARSRNDDADRRLRGHPAHYYVTELPLLVDADTGWGSAFTIARTVREMIRAGAVHATSRTRCR